MSQENLIQLGRTTSEWEASSFLEIKSCLHVLGHFKASVHTTNLVSILNHLFGSLFHEFHEITVFGSLHIFTDDILWLLSH